MAEGTIDQLREDFERLRREKIPDRDWCLDRALHSAVAEACGNPRLTGEIARYRDLVQTMREAVGSVLADIHSTSLIEHLRLLRCLKQRDPAAAAAAMRQHLAQAAKSAVKALRNLRQ